MYPKTPLVTVPVRCSRHLSLVVLVSILSAGAAFAAPPVAPLGVTVAAVQGDVSVTTQARRLDVHKGDVVPLPATIDTGPSGSIELRQGNTTLSAAPNSQLVIPAPAVAGEPIDRVIQTRGNAFYNIAKRETRKLHVESAYLVAVIKGTQFSVVAQDDSATISLFEGRLEVRATDGSDVVDLQAGEIAIRHANDTAIRMLRMATGEPVGHRALARSATAVASSAGPSPAGSSSMSGGADDAGNPGNASGDSSARSTGSGSPGAGGAGSASLGSGSSTVGGGVTAGLAAGSIGTGAGRAPNLGIGSNVSSSASASTIPGSGPTSGSSGLVANMGNKSAGSNSADGANPGNGQGGSNNDNGQGGSNHGNGQGGAKAGSGGDSNSGNGSAGVSAGGNANPGNGNGGANNGNGHGGASKAVLRSSPNIGNGAVGVGAAINTSTNPTNTLGTAITTAVTPGTGINLGAAGAPAGSAANSNPVGGLLGSVPRPKGSPGRP